MKGNERIAVPRAVLLIEVSRDCFFPDCNARVSLGLTKSEAINYRGFECAVCKRWNDDLLAERDVPEWWAEVSQS
jgi:hypothetical protein